MSSKDYIDILESNLIKIYCSQTYNGAGIIDLQGKLIIPFDYNIIDYYPNQKVFIGRIFEGGSESDKLFFLDIHGKKILPMSFKDISLSEDNLFALQTKNDKCFFVDSGGNLKIPEFNCSYNYTFSDGLRIFEEKRKYGYMNKEGKIIIPAKYCYAYNFSNGWGLVMDGEKENCSDRTSWMFLDKKGNTILTLSYSDYYHVSDLNELGLIPVCKGEGCGYVNKQGVIVIPLKYFPGAKYSGLSNIYDKYLMVDTLEYISNKTVFRSGVLDSYGNVVIPLIYKTLTFTETNLLYACKDDFHCGFIDFKNNPVIPFKYSISFGPYGYQDLGFKNDISVCLKKTDKEKCDETHVGYIDMQGNEFWE